MDLDKKECGTSSDQPAGEWNRVARKMTQRFEETPHPIFCCAELFLKGDLKSKKGKKTIHFQSTSPTKTLVIRTIFACNQLCIYAAVCVLLDQNNQNKEALHRGVPELSEADPTNLTHRKDLPASGDRVRDSKDSSVTRCRFLGRSWQRQERRLKGGVRPLGSRVQGCLSFFILIFFLYFV